MPAASLQRSPVCDEGSWDPRESRRDSTPLWPTGHLPRKEGDRPSSRLSPITNFARGPRPTKLPISPLVGEMSGRTEGAP
ncbi:MAG: hypothetical protein EOS27_28210 [Mesorhizobium sp.]|nr:MAG: hypothetical protein EOS27_28210 [Mesorhizobium sp.]TIX21149.1 MAG: hypothetical protein E5V35_30425 [Mesorhizobium sp.]